MEWEQNNLRVKLPMETTEQGDASPQGVNAWQMDQLSILSDVINEQPR